MMRALIGGFAVVVLVVAGQAAPPPDRPPPDKPPPAQPAPVQPAPAQPAQDAEVYDLVIKNVQVMTTTENNEAWDINNGKPDLLVIARNMSEKDSKPFETKEMADTFAAEFNATAIFQVRAGQRIELTVLDLDLAAHDTIGRTQKELTREILDAGTLRLEKFGRVIHLELEFKKR